MIGSSSLLRLRFGLVYSTKMISNYLLVCENLHLFGRIVNVIVGTEFVSWQISIEVDFLLYLAQYEVKSSAYKNFDSHLYTLFAGHILF